MNIEFNGVEYTHNRMYSDIIIEGKISGCLIEILPPGFSRGEIRTIYQICVPDKDLKKIKHVSGLRFSETESENYTFVQCDTLEKFIEVYNILKIDRKTK